ncbi:hypothetical protein B0E54_05572 [Micromonospora sp. MH99]|nr:hypothetical protein [Micromonospora sp. MH99]
MKAHRTDLLSFAFGLVFLALSAWWLLAQLLGLALPPVGWFLAGALILIGIFGLVGALRSGRSGRPESNDVADPATIAAPQAGTSTSAFGPVTAVEPGMPTSGAPTPTSGAGVPAWTAEHSTWDTPLPPEAPTVATRAPEAPTAEMRLPEAPTAEMRAPEASADAIHPAWLAHGASEPPTSPVSGQPGDGSDQPTRPDHLSTTTGDDPADEREGRRRES